MRMSPRTGPISHALLAGALVALACRGDPPARPAAPPGAASLTPAATPDASSPRPAATPESATAPPAPPSASASPASTVPTPAPPPAPVPAFVVYARNATTLVPVDPAVPARTAAGLWLQDGDAVRLLFTAPLGDPAACDCPGLRCSTDRLNDVDPNSSGPPCPCVTDAGDHASGPISDGAWDGDERSEEDCTEWSEQPVSLFGDTLYWHGSHHSLCGGINRYDARGSEFDLSKRPAGRPGDSAELLRRLGPTRCSPDIHVGEPNPPWPLDELQCKKSGETWVPVRPGATDDCFHCGEFAAETEIWLLRRGRIHRIEDNVFHAGGQRWVASVPAAPELCPSPADPCGDPAGFPGLARSADFWVASGGEAALSRAGGKLAIHLPGRKDSRKSASVSGDILGVRFHADAGALQRAIARALAPLPAAEAPCADDHGCRLRLGCGGFCGVDHRCRDRRTGACDGAHECPGDATCEQDRCRLAARLADEDRPLLDAKTGLGDRCAVHLREGRLAAARGACEAALERATTDAARGAILYNLGRIAETIGDLAGARAHYQQSLARRRNTTVKRALDRVSR